MGEVFGYVYVMGAVGTGVLSAYLYLKIYFDTEEKNESLFGWIFTCVAMCPVWALIWPFVIKGIWNDLSNFEKNKKGAIKQREHQDWVAGFQEDMDKPPPPWIDPKRFSVEIQAKQVTQRDSDTLESTASRLISNWLLHVEEYESLGPSDQEIVKREIYRVYQQTLSDYPSILSIERSSLIPVLDAYHVQFREIAKANVLKGLAGRILIIAYKSTIFCSNDVAEDFKEFAFSLVLEGKDLEENSAVNLSSTNSYNTANKTVESVVVSSHPILNEYIDLCRKFNLLSLTAKYEARLALHEIYEAVFDLHGYVTCTRVFNEEQFLAIRKTINENSTGTELKRIMGEFMWSTLLCLRFGDAALRSLADENFGETCLSEDDCSYEAFIADLEIQNIRVPDAGYTILTKMSTDDTNDAIICPSCKKCVLILKWKSADRCRFCNSNIKAAKLSAAEKKASAPPDNQTIGQTSKSKQLSSTKGSSSASTDKAETESRNLFKKEVRCVVCSFMFDVDVLDREAHCPRCNQWNSVA